MSSYDPRTGAALQAPPESTPDEVDDTVAAAVAAAGELAESVPAVGDVRGRGAMLALEFVEPGGEFGGKTPSPTTAAAVAKYCHERGVLVLTCGTYSNVIRLLPPLVIDFELLDDAVDVLAEAVRKVAG